MLSLAKGRDNMTTTSSDNNNNNFKITTNDINTKGFVYIMSRRVSDAIYTNNNPSSVVKRG